MITMLMESVSLMDIHVNTSGHLLELLMRWEHSLTSTVLALTEVELHIQHNHLALLVVITFVTLPVKVNGHIHFTQMIPFGMELVVDRPTPAALSTTLHGS